MSENYKYNELPNAQEIYIDPSNSTIIDNVDPWEKIKYASKKYGLEIQEPLKNCKKCYGRGYISIDHNTQNPNPCTCIYPPVKTEEEQFMRKNAEANFINKYPNRKQRRFYERQARKRRN